MLSKRAISFQDLTHSFPRNPLPDHSIGEDVRRFSYNIPDTPLYKHISIDMLIYYHIEIDRAALGRTILNGMQRLRNQIKDHGDSYLLDYEDPWQIDDKRTGMSSSLKQLFLPLAFYLPFFV